MNCLWCHNPESQSFHKEILYNREKCTVCRQCQRKCTQEAIEFSGGATYPIKIDVLLPLTQQW
ncbi:MAG: hypothetical protein ACOY3U_04815 [Bacillota bacterium]|uniref:hypothetical protein n=1 Tax=Desulforamulus profundi TaxID=1383067 RepID=UPI000BFFF635